MSIQYKFFQIFVRDSQASESEMNRFLRSVRIINIYREFVPQDGNSFWSIAIEYQPNEESGEAAGKWKGKSKIDYREVLSPEDFSIFAKLREWRKEASHQAGIPLYSIFTNEQLAKIAENRVTSKSGLQKIDGVGEARVKKYGEDIAKIVRQFSQAEGKQDQ